MVRPKGDASRRRTAAASRGVRRGREPAKRQVASQGAALCWMPIHPYWNPADGSHQPRGALLTHVAGPPSSPVFTHGFCRGAQYYPMRHPSESRVQEGLNDYRFKASLSVEHPAIGPDEATKALGLEPASVRHHDQPRLRPDGSPLPGVVTGNHWAADLKIATGQDIPAFLLDFIEHLPAEATGWMRMVADTGGCVSLFLGVFADGCCDFEIPAAILGMLGNAGVAIRLDFYRNCGKAEPPNAMDSR